MTTRPTTQLNPSPHTNSIPTPNSVKRTKGVRGQAPEIHKLMPGMCYVALATQIGSFFLIPSFQLFTTNVVIRTLKLLSNDISIQFSSIFREADPGGLGACPQKTLIYMAEKIVGCHDNGQMGELPCRVEVKKVVRLVNARI
jgi:hypothetical protein